MIRLHINSRLSSLQRICCHKRTLSLHNTPSVHAHKDDHYNEEIQIDGLNDQIQKKIATKNMAHEKEK